MHGIFSLCVVVEELNALLLLYGFSQICLFFFEFKLILIIEPSLMLEEDMSLKEISGSASIEAIWVADNLDDSYP